MGKNTKIATCCYCGTKAVMQLGGSSERHELTCASCGAQLHDMKMLRVSATRDHERERKPARQPKPKFGGATPHASRERELYRGKKGKKKSKKKSLGRRFLSEAFDVLEDIFD